MRFWLSLLIHLVSRLIYRKIYNCVSLLLSFSLFSIMLVYMWTENCIFSWIDKKQKNSKSNGSELKDDNGITMFSFLTPFSSSMWLSIVVAYVMVSLMMFFVSRISPYERYRIGNHYQVCSEGKHSLQTKFDEVKNQIFSYP